MTDTSLAIGNNKYQEDISMLPAGTELIGQPCTVWDITVCLETTALAVISFSNSVTTYDNASRIGKVVLQGPNTQHFTFPKGRHCTVGLSAVSSTDSVDVRVSYD